MRKATAIDYVKRIHSVVNGSKVDTNAIVATGPTDYDLNAVQIVIQEKYPFYNEFIYWIEKIPIDESFWIDFGKKIEDEKH